MKPHRIIFLILILAALSARGATLAQTPNPAAQEWTQDAHDAQRAGYTAEEPLEPWRLLWTWNGPDSNGGVGGHLYDAPREARVITGGSYVYVPAGASGLYALSKQNGQPAWNIKPTRFNATPAYDPTTGYLYANGEDGRIYKIESRTGSVAQTYTAGNPLNKSVLLVGGFVYGVTDNGQLHKVNTTNMSRVWVYSANAPIATPPSYSASRDLVVYATNDLYVHGVKNSDGAAKWRVKPTPNPPGFPNELDGMWPVIAEQPGVVFLRMRLDHNAGVWGGPGKGGMFPNTNAETRTFLQQNPQLKNLFALSLDTGQEAFVPAVGYGGEEITINGQPYLDVSSVPVVRVLPDGKTVAYQLFRNGQSNPPDGRWDTHMGEMVLDNQTISGMVAGDLRFVQFTNAPIFLTDEQTPISMAGNTIFDAHWATNSSIRITDRSSSLGSTYSNPIRSQNHPNVIRRMVACNNFDTATHWTTCNLSLFNDTRTWTGPGWWVYWNINDPPTGGDRAAANVEMRPRYTIVSDGLVILVGNGGDLFVLKHSGTSVTVPLPTLPPPTATTVTPTKTVTPLPPTATVTTVPPTTPPTSTPVPPTATTVPPTATATTVPPTFTQTPVSPTAIVVTTVPPASTPSATPSTPAGAALRVAVNPPVAAPGAAIDVALSLQGVANLYGLEVACGVNPAILAGTAHLGADAFNDSNALFVDQGFRPDGSWTVAATRLRPHAPISGDSAAFTLRYTVLAAGSSPITCTARAVDANGHDLPLTVLNTSFNPPGAPTPTLPPGTPTAPTPTVTTVAPTTTPSTGNTISGVITFPGRSNHTGITVALAAGDTPLAQLTTTASGAYRFTDVPPGDYSLTIIASQALPMQQSVTLAADGAGGDLGTHTLPMGDTDASGTIDLADAALVSANYGLEASRLPAADLNADAVINLRDLVLVGSSFGLAAPVPLQ